MESFLLNAWVLAVFGIPCKNVLEYFTFLSVILEAFGFIFFGFRKTEPRAVGVAQGYSIYLPCVRPSHSTEKKDEQGRKEGKDGGSGGERKEAMGRRP